MDKGSRGWLIRPLSIIAAFLMSLALVACTGTRLQAQTPNPVTNGYQVCTTDSAGVSHCSFQPVDATHGLPVSGGAGSVSNANSGVATTSTNIPTVAYNYVWNGLTWDQSTGLVAGTLGVPSSQYLSVQGPASGGGYPTAATAITGNATGTTGAVVGTLAGTGGKTTYICGFDVSAIGGTAAVGPITVAGLTGSSMVYQMSSSASGNTFSRSFSPCIPASAVNTVITVTTTANGTATAVDVNSWGFQQ